MSKEKKVEKVDVKTKGKELNFDDLNKVSGGSVTSVKYTKTKPISKGTQQKS